MTQLGLHTHVVVALGCVVLAAIETRRTRSRWIVSVHRCRSGRRGDLQTVIKQIVDRARPVLFNPAAATLGPSFPSGHSTTAAAFYASAALLLGRRRPRAARATLTGAAAGTAIAVATSRVLLDDHWLTDVRSGGLALGWAWFAICGSCLRCLLHLGAAAEIARASRRTRRLTPDRRREHVAKRYPAAAAPSNAAMPLARG